MSDNDDDVIAEVSWTKLSKRAKGKSFKGKLLLEINFKFPAIIASSLNKSTSARYDFGQCECMLV